MLHPGGVFRLMRISVPNFFGKTVEAVKKGPLQGHDFDILRYLVFKWFSVVRVRYVKRV